ncbi:hypothetical protein TEA_013203 [Camellia sinensis var. sinensis]|uniref:DUF4378 domain-containing protein n=1 Tax=Camellia sinensis var. sinensis TaxID=542762 RepID=A0A4S4EKE8_CAMSN|nr:hypothetical protein TEA_013203 [Camellia sinensis var. sinensis]
MGCMAGFFQLFDRHQILTGKRLYSTKRLTTSTVIFSFRFLLRLFPRQSRPFEIFFSGAGGTGEIAAPKEGTRSSWKFRKEAPRLSLDSRATTDATGSLYPKEIRTNAAILTANGCENSVDGDDKRRSPSVIARLMGLEQLPHSSPEPMKKAELRRSASESRVSRDLFHHRIVDSNNFKPKQQNQSHFVGNNISSNVIRDNAAIGSKTSLNVRPADPMTFSSRNANSESENHFYRSVCASSQWKSPQQRKSFFDSEDFFPEPKQSVSMYGEIEKRLKMRGIDEPSKDLETLRQILEALQLKGLLHSQKPSHQINHRNFVHNRSFSSDESPIVVMKSSRSSVSPINRRSGNDSPPPGFTNRAGVRRSLSFAGEYSSPRSESPEINRNLRNQARLRNSSSPTCNAKSPSSPARRRPMNVETPRKAAESMEQQQQRQRVSPVHSPKRIGSDQTNTNRSPRNRKPTAEIDPKKKIAIVIEDESTSISESSASTSSQTDTERSKMEGGRSLLERCDKLLHSIAEMTSGTELQPSPVSVLDSSFYKDESSSPSPVMKRNIDFKDELGEFEEDIWSPVISPIQSKCEDKSDDCNFVYISDILRASNYLPEDYDIFQLLEKQQYLKGNNTSRVSSLERKLIFDTVSEILDRDREMPPWKVLSWSNSSIGKPPLHQIWSEFQRIRERDTAEDLFDIVCGVLRKDLAGDAISGWGDCPVEMSEATLDIERMIFKDLVGETIGDLVAFAGNSKSSAYCRKLVF